jgi:hypothetical protein
MKHRDIASFFGKKAADTAEGGAGAQPTKPCAKATSKAAGSKAPAAGGSKAKGSSASPAAGSGGGAAKRQVRARMTNKQCRKPGVVVAACTQPARQQQHQRHPALSQHLTHTATRLSAHTRARTDAGRG